MICLKSLTARRCQGRDLGSRSSDSRAHLLKHSAILPYVCVKTTMIGRGKKTPLSLLHASFQGNVCSKFLTVELQAPCIPPPSPHAGILGRTCSLSLNWLPFLKSSHDPTIHYLGAVNSKQNRILSIVRSRSTRKKTILSISSHPKGSP